MTLSDSASGDAYIERLQSASGNPYVVGAMWFDYSDEPLTGRGNSDGVGNIKSDLVIGEDFAFGMVDVTDRPKYDLVNKVRAANLAALEKDCLPLDGVRSGRARKDREPAREERMCDPKLLSSPRTIRR